ncbi:MAG: methyl-accepting chemotaxis protein [Gammaproteobacteria bacterium]
MNWFHNLSFRYKLMLPLTLLAVLIIVLAVRAMTLVTELGNRGHELAGFDLPAVNYLLQADRDLYQAQVAERSMIFVDVKSDTFADLTKQHMENIKQARERVGKFFAIAEETGLMEELGIAEHQKIYETARKEWEGLTRKVYDERASNTRVGRTNAIEISFGPAAKSFETMRNELDVLSEIVLKRAEQTSASVEKAVSSGNVQMTVLLVVSFLICGLLAFALPPLITGPMKRMIAHLENIAEGDGDLTVRLETHSRDEMGRMAHAFNQFVAKLQNIVKNSVTSTDQLGDASQRLTLVAAESRENISAQLSEIEQVATGMNEMTATVQEVARNAQQAADAAMEADNESRNGKEVVQETVNAMNRLAENVQNSAAIIQKLREESGNIGAVLGVIKGVADQTNLLALNAAIEAARAGEQGRGFAVVADEVRQLASRTQKSTQEIQEMIETLQASAEQAVEVMDRGRSQAEQSVQQAAAADEALTRIASAVATITDMNTQIASAAEEQAAVMEELNRNTSSIQSLADRSTEASQQTSEAADQLAGLAVALKGELSQFTV